MRFATPRTSGHLALPLLVTALSVLTSLTSASSLISISPGTKLDMANSEYVNLSIKLTEMPSNAAKARVYVQPEQGVKYDKCFVEFTATNRRIPQIIKVYRSSRSQTSLVKAQLYRSGLSTSDAATTVSVATPSPPPSAKSCTVSSKAKVSAFDRKGGPISAGMYTLYRSLSSAVQVKVIPTKIQAEEIPTKSKLKTVISNEIQAVAIAHGSATFVYDRLRRPPMPNVVPTSIKVSSSGNRINVQLGDGTKVAIETNSTSIMSVEVSVSRTFPKTDQGLCNERPTGKTWDDLMKASKVSNTTSIFNGSTFLTQELQRSQSCVPLSGIVWTV